MQPPNDLVRVIGKKRYSVETATLLAHDAYWDGHNFERSGRNTFLYCTPHGAYFTVYLSQWQGEQGTQLTPIEQEQAIGLYEGSLSEHEVSYTEAFPGIKITEA